MAGKKPVIPVQVPDYQPGSYKVLGPEGHAAGLASGTSMESQLFRQSWKAYEALSQRAERMASREMGLGEGAKWGSHPQLSVRWGNLVNWYLKRLFPTAPEAAPLRASGWQVTPDGVYGVDFYHPRWRVAFDATGVSERSVEGHAKYARDGYAVLVRPSAARGFMARLNCGLGRAGTPLMLALQIWEQREKIWKDAEMGLYRGGLGYYVFDDRLFRAILSSMPHLTVLPYDYPVERYGKTEGYIEDGYFRNSLRKNWERYSVSGAPPQDLSCLSMEEMLKRGREDPYRDFYWFKDEQGYWRLARWSCPAPPSPANQPSGLLSLSLRTLGAAAVRGALTGMLGAGVSPPSQSGSGARFREPGPSGSKPATSPPSPPAKGSADQPPRDVPIGPDSGLPITSLRVPGRHTVKPGENLSAIAARYYGKPSAWPKLYNYNRDVIGPNPHHLRKGLVLRLP